MSKQVSRFSLDRDTGAIRDLRDFIGKVPLPDSLNPSKRVTPKDTEAPRPGHLDPYHNMANEPLPEKPHHEIRYLYGPLDGKTNTVYQEHPPEQIAVATGWEKDPKNGHLWAPFTNDYAIYLQDPEDPYLLVLFGYEHREIDIAKGKDYLISKHWVDIR